MIVSLFASVLCWAASAVWNVFACSAGAGFGQEGGAGGCQCGGPPRAGRQDREGSRRPESGVLLGG